MNIGNGGIGGAGGGGGNVYGSNSVAGNGGSGGNGGNGLVIGEIFKMTEFGFLVRRCTLTLYDSDSNVGPERGGGDSSSGK